MCEHCQKYTKYLLLSLKTYIGLAKEKPYTCEHCQKYTKVFTSSLKTHMRTNPISARSIASGEDTKYDMGNSMYCIGFGMGYFIMNDAYI